MDFREFYLALCSWRRLVSILLIGCGLAAQPAEANNLKIANPEVKAEWARGYASIGCDVSWENSWRVTSEEPAGVIHTNWDAAWIFAKYRTKDGVWRHASLKGSRGDHEAGPGAALQVGLASGTEGESFGVGVFLYRSAEGSGPWGSRVNLCWDCARDGVDGSSQVEVSIHAIEMVYVPRGAFYLGSGGDERGEFTDGRRVAGNTIPFVIGSEKPLRIANEPGAIWRVSVYPGDSIGPPGELPAAYPKGYRAFYCMKYELTQGLYADFLNRLAPSQAACRYPNHYNECRFSIVARGGVYQAEAPDRACNFLSWHDGLAFADWAGLRPMTELEYEKACRGPLTPLPGEFAWGTTVITPLTGFCGDDGSGAETALPSGANCNFKNRVQGPVRAGIFASATSGRGASGATFWGILEMSGNLWERAVTVGTIAGRRFGGEHGDGTLDSMGEANVPGWPGPAGAGFRGGSWQNVNVFLSVSSRRLAACAHKDRKMVFGFRAVRTAPEE